MCTAISVNLEDHYFGRNLDLEYHYNEEVVITPRAFPLPFKNVSTAKGHFAIIGIATVIDGYPLYYDAVNEYGLAMAGLNFPGNAVYQTKKDNVLNIAPFELILYILGNCKSVIESKEILNNINLCDQSFKDELPLTPMHWIISDKESSIVIEPMESGIQIYENPIGVLSNNPPFSYHQYNLSNYMNLSAAEPENRMTNNIDITPYSRGMAAIGLPGDLSSASRFVRAAFVKLNAAHFETKNENVEQFFHILASVEQQSGCVRVKNGNVSTIYASCCNTTDGIYYYKTYFNSRITAINMREENISSNELIRYPLRLQPDILNETKNQRM